MKKVLVINHRSSSTRVSNNLRMQWKIHYCSIQEQNLHSWTSQSHSFAHFCDIMKEVSFSQYRHPPQAVFTGGCPKREGEHESWAVTLLPHSHELCRYGAGIVRCGCMQTVLTAYSAVTTMWCTMSEIRKKLLHRWALICSKRNRWSEQGCQALAKAEAILSTVW